MKFATQSSKSRVQDARVAELAGEVIATCHVLHVTTAIVRYMAALHLLRNWHVPYRLVGPSIVGNLYRKQY